MAKVTSKLQLTLPKRIAEQYGIAPGDEVEVVAAGDVIRLVPPRKPRASRLSPRERLRLFDAASTRQREREAGRTPPAKASDGRDGRDWEREDLYARGKPIDEPG